MKVSIVLLALVAGSFSAPQSRKVFHEHVQDFIDVIEGSVGPELQQIMEEYLEHDEVLAALNYLKTMDFRDLFYEIESLPEFKAVIDYLENNNIDVKYFIDILNNMAGAIDVVANKQVRLELSGTDFNSFIQECINFFPKDQIVALYHQKMEEDQEFREAMEVLMSEEMKDLFDNLLESESFQAKIKETLTEIGIEFDVLIEHIMSILEHN